MSKIYVVLSYSCCFVAFDCVGDARNFVPENRTAAWIPLFSDCMGRGMPRPYGCGVEPPRFMSA
jgi:hypothetical protein